MCRDVNHTPGGKGEEYRLFRRGSELGDPLSMELSRHIHMANSRGIEKGTTEKERDSPL